MFRVFFPDKIDVPMTALGTYPTPVERPFPATPRLSVKRDDLSGELYGGNKVRKLERLLSAARAAGKRRLLTLGAVGSHHVLATAIYGAREGFEVEAVLVSQPASAHAEANVRAALAHGLRARAAPAWAVAPAIVASRMGRDAHWITLGGSSADASLAFVDAAHELAVQVRAGEIDAPDVVVVATGSGGTVAGLAVGLEDAGLSAKVVGVAIASPVPMLRVLTRRLAAATARAAGLDRAATRRALGRIVVDGTWLGRGYGFPTEAGASAQAVAARAGLVLDPTYTAKAFACALDLVDRDTRANVLFWHTLSRSVPQMRFEGPLPPEIARLLLRP